MPVVIQDEKDSREVDRTVCSASDIRPIIAKIVDSMEYKKLTPEQLIAEEVVEKDRFDKPIGVRADYDLVVGHKKWPEISVAGAAVPKVHFEMVVRHYLALEMESLRTRQPSCDWRLVAAKLIRNMGETEYLTNYRDPTLSIAADIGRALAERQGNLNKTKPVSVDRKTDVARRLEISHDVIYVFADISGHGMDDMGVQQIPDYEGGEGVMARYSRTRQLRHLPRGMQFDRRMAVDILKEVISHRAAAGVDSVRLSELAADDRDLHDSGLPNSLVAEMIRLRVDEDLNFVKIAEAFPGYGLTAKRVGEIITPELAATSDAVAAARTS